MTCKRFVFLLSCVACLLPVWNNSAASRPPIIVETDIGEYMPSVRGEDFSVMEQLVVATDAAGNQLVSTNRYTILETGLNYLENGEWKKSEDTVESFPRGAVARRGPHQAIFSSNMNSDAVFDLQTAAGIRFRGGVRSLHLTDVATGRSVLLGTVKDNAMGKVVPPNKVVYQSAFDGVEADVVYVWTHNTFSQNVILKERVQLAPGMDPRNSQLEIATEVLVDEEPEIVRAELERPGGAVQVDDSIIDWGALVALPGKAFGYNALSGFGLGAEALRQREGLYVGKEWYVSDDGRTYIIESVEWDAAEAEIQKLPARRRAQIDAARTREVAFSRTWAEQPGVADEFTMPLADDDYSSDGLVVDLVTVPGSASSYTFVSGETYHVTGLAYLGSGTVSFEAGSVIKFSNNAYILAFGPLSFPSTLQRPIFTSKDDDTTGKSIPGSTGSPAYHADPALMVYYPNFVTNIENAWFRWAKTGVEYFSNPWSGVTHTINDTLFQDCQTGVSVDVNSSVSLTNVEKCDVSTATSGSGSVSGSMSNAATCVDSAFLALNTLTGAAEPPDTMGSIGVSHYVETINNRIVVFDRSGTLLEWEYLREFFGVSTSIARDAVADPRIVYDHSCQKWIVCAMQRGIHGADLLLAVSKNSSPAGLQTNWTILNKSLGEPNLFIDYPTIGLDSNGVYIVAHLFDSLHNPTVFKQRVVAIKKNNCLDAVSASDVKVVPTSISGNSAFFTIQPAVNFDSVSSGDYAWFVAKDPYVVGTSTPLTYGKLEWVGANPDLVSGAFSSSISVPSSYYDMDDTSITFSPPHQNNGASQASIVTTGSRLQMAVIRDDKLWTTHHVGVNSTGGYSGTPSDATRSAAQWIRLNVNSSTLSYSTHGKIYDGASSTPYWYYFPSLMINNAGDMVIGFSGSKTSEYIGAFYSWRLANSTTAPAPLLLQRGVDVFVSSRLGDYSYTSLDPTDDDVFWTVQQFGGINGFRVGASGFTSTAVAEIRIK